MEYVAIIALGVIAFVGWGFAYLLHGELSQKEEYIQELLVENQSIASQLLRKETKACLSKRKRGLKSGGSTKSETP
jgi:hypothetical protein